jgi:ribosomal protein S18 acetylase RimI-like enzyme
MFIEKVDALTDEIVEAVHRLIPEIGMHKPLPTHDELAALIRSAASTLLVARYPDAQGLIAGMLTITIYQVPTGIRSTVEDVAVDSNFRRKGIAKALMETALIIAKGAGANGVALTSNPKREAANRLYQAMGFERRETNAYMYRFQDK